MKGKKFKLGERKFIIVLFFIVLSIYLYMQSFVKSVDTSTNKVKANMNTIENQTVQSEYPIIKKDENSNYPGIGRKEVENKEGYFTTFTTADNNKKTYKEYKQNFVSWAENKYWGGTMEENGCGITVMSIILSGYNKHYTPENLRKKYYPVLNYDTLPSELSFKYNIKNSGFYYMIINTYLIIALWNI